MWHCSWGINEFEEWESSDFERRQVPRCFFSLRFYVLFDSITLYPSLTASLRYNNSVAKDAVISAFNLGYRLPSGGMTNILRFDSV